MLSNFLPLTLGLVIFSFLITAVLVVPFVDLLYKLRLTRRKEAPKSGKIPLFDKLHDKKAGTPVGGGVLLISIVSILFAFLMPTIAKMGVFIHSSFDLTYELLIIFLTFILFGILGALDDYKTIFGKPKPGNLGAVFGLTKKHKFGLQVVL